MIKSLMSLICILIASILNAQPIKDHPQKSFYNSLDEYVDVSAQIHWRVLFNGNLVIDNTCALASNDDLTCAHIHNNLKCPIYMIMNAGDTATCKFTIVEHHFPGYISAVYPRFKSLDPTQNIIYDATGTSVPPMMIGDPFGDKTFTGHFTVTLPAQVMNWWFIVNEVCFQFNNGDAGCNSPIIPIWSSQHPDHDSISFGFPLVGARSIDMVSKSHPEVTWGVLSVEYDGLIPLAPINQPWTVPVAFYSYGRTNLIAGTNQIRYNMDLHHMIPGQIEFQSVQAEDLGMSWTFDPAVIGQGTHNVAALRVQPDGAEQLTTVLVIPVTVGDVVIPPPPPPIIDWHTINGVLQRLNDQIRICDPVDNKCLVLGIIQ